MTPGWQKRIFYSMFRIPMRVNGALHRRAVVRRRANGKRVQLGPGQKNYLSGWINVDANFLTAKPDLWADLRDPLPFPANSVKAFYSHHVIEHLADYRLASHFLDMFNCLVPGGMIRVGGPNADAAIRKYLDGDLAWFGDFPERKHSIGGKLANFLLCRGEHLAILTPSYLTELALDAGFTDVRICRPQSETSYPDVFDEFVLGMEWGDDPTCPGTVLVEAKKPMDPVGRAESMAEKLIDSQSESRE